MKKQPTPPSRQVRRAEKRKFDAAIKRTERHGLDCCGAPITSIQPTVVVKDERTGRLEIHHSTCLLEAKSTDKVVVGVHACFTANELFIEQDRIWFEQHPGRDMYARAPAPEEWFALSVRSKHTALRNNQRHDDALFHAPPDEQVVVVIQIEPGQRLRLPCNGNHVDIEAQLAAGDRSALGDAAFYIPPVSQERVPLPWIVASTMLKAVGEIEEDAFDDAAFLAAGDVIAAAKEHAV